MNELADESPRHRWIMGLAVVVFLATGAIFLPHYQYRINADATAYVTLARHYLAHRWDAAINAYWGPLLAWLLAAGLKTGLAPLLAARVVGLVIGFVGLFAVAAAGRALGLRPMWAHATALAMAVPLAGYALVLVTPDLLLAVLLLFYAATVLSDRYRGGPYRGLLAGLLGGLAYLAKSYAFPFFVAHFVAINILHAVRGWRDRRRARVGEAGVAASPTPAPAPPRSFVLRNFVAGLLVFAVIAGTWVLLLHGACGVWTIGTSGARTHAIVGPDIYPDDPLFDRLLPPPTTQGVSCWDDPTGWWSDPAAPIRLSAWQPWASPENRAHQWLLVQANGKAMSWDIACFTPLGVIALVILIGAIFSRGVGQIRRVALPLVGTVALFAAGYLLVWYEIRYLWFVVALLVLAGALALQQLVTLGPLGRGGVALLIAWLVASCALPAGRDLVARSDQDRDIHELAAVLHNRYGVHGNLASNARWPKALGVAFHLNARYFGQPPEKMTAADLPGELRRHGVDYYLVWGRDARIESAGWKDVTGGRIKGLRVYRVPLATSQP